MIDTLLAISTFKKNSALDVIVNSLITNNYSSRGHILIHDDATGNAKEIYEKYKDKCKLSFSYGTSRMGIWGNKNRAINFFLEKTNYPFLITMDDDIEFSRGGLIEELIAASKNSNYQHITTYLGGTFKHIDKDDGSRIVENGFFDQFPPFGEDEFLYWCKGSQGICNFYTRNIIEKVGYMKPMPGIYGYEHSEYSSRCNKVQGYQPELCAILKRSPRYFKTQLIANNYEVNYDEMQKGNGKKYMEYMKLIYDGYQLHQKESGLKKGEITIE